MREEKQISVTVLTICHLLSVTYFPSHQNDQQVETISLFKLNFCTVILVAVL